MTSIASEPPDLPTTLRQGSARAVSGAVLSVSCLIEPEVVVVGGSIGSRHELFAEVDRYLARCVARPSRTALDGLYTGPFGLEPALGAASASPPRAALAA